MIKKIALTTLLLSTAIANMSVHASEDVIVETTNIPIVETTTLSSKQDDVPQETTHLTTTVPEETEKQNDKEDEKTSETSLEKTEIETSTTLTEQPKQEDVMITRHDETASDVQVNEKNKINVSKLVKQSNSVVKEQSSQFQNDDMTLEKEVQETKQQAMLPKTSSKSYGVFGIFLLPLSALLFWLGRKGLV